MCRRYIDWSVTRGRETERERVTRRKRHLHPGSTVSMCVILSRLSSALPLLILSNTQLETLTIKLKTPQPFPLYFRYNIKNVLFWCALIFQWHLTTSIERKISYYFPLVYNSRIRMEWIRHVDTNLKCKNLSDKKFHYVRSLLLLEYCCSVQPLPNQYRLDWKILLHRQLSLSTYTLQSSCLSMVIIKQGW